MRKPIGLILIIAILFVVILLFATGEIQLKGTDNGEVSNYPPPANSSANMPGGNQYPNASGTTELLVRYSGTAFSPSDLVVPAGSVVAFENDSNSPFWPASNNHPTHTLYPGSSAANCGTPNQAANFDACGAVPPGARWSFKFDQIGVWGYHNHLNPGVRGTITVR